VFKSRRVRWVGQVACVQEMKNAYKILVQKPEGKRPLGRPKYKWKYNIRMENCCGKVWTIFIWLRIGTGGVLL